jgi:ABC-type transporter Mla subunit MlaD
VTLDEIDRTLARFHEAAERMTANLVELDSDPNRKLLDKASLTGVTAERWAPAAEALTQLWQWFSQLKDLVERADQLRAGKKLPELNDVLGGQSVELSRDQVPLAERGLFGSSETSIHCTPDDLLDRMSDAFDKAKEVISATGQVWAVVLPRLEQTQSELTRIEQLAAGLGETHLPELRPVRDGLKQVADTLASDPLAVDSRAVDTFDTTLAGIRRELEGIAEIRDRFPARLDEARDVLANLEEAVRESAEAHAETVLRIASPAVPAAARLDPSFGRHLDQIGALAARSEWRAVRAELDEWTTRARELLAHAQRSVTQNRAPVEVRNELRGRLDGYRAKANHLGRLENATLEALYQQAHDMLYTAPTDLTAAAELVRQYAQALPTTPPKEVPS